MDQYVIEQRNVKSEYIPQNKNNQIGYNQKQLFLYTSDHKDLQDMINKNQGESPTINQKSFKKIDNQKNDNLKVKSLEQKNYKDSIKEQALNQVMIQVELRKSQSLKNQTQKTEIKKLESNNEQIDKKRQQRPSIIPNTVQHEIFATQKKFQENQKNLQVKSFKSKLLQGRIKEIVKKLVNGLSTHKFQIFLKNNLNMYVRDKVTFLSETYENINKNSLENKSSFKLIKRKKQQQENTEVIDLGNNIVLNYTIKPKKSQQSFRQFFMWEMKQKKRKIKKFLSNIKPVDPNQKYSIICDIIDLVQIIWQFILVTMTSLYGMDDSPNFFTLTRVYSMIYLIFDIFNQFNKGFYKNGELILDRKQIALNYLKGQFFNDIVGVSVLMFTSISKTYWDLDNDPDYKLINILVQWLFFVKMYTLYIVCSRIEYLLYLYGLAGHIYSLIKMLINLVIICHFIGILYFMIGLLEIHFKVENNWIEIINLQDETWTMQYMQSFYFAMATLMLIGSQGQTVYEITFVTVILCVTVGIFGYLIGNINLIITEMNMKTKDYKDDLRIINIYLKQYKIKDELSSKVRGVLEHSYQSKTHIDNVKLVQEVFKKLPQEVQLDIKLDIQLGILQQYSFFKLNFLPETLQKLALIMEQKCYLTNQTIFESGQHADPKLYLIQHGKVELYCQHSSGKDQPQVLLKQFERGALLGDFPFLTDTAAIYSAKCTSFATIYEIKRDKFLDILSQKAEDFQKCYMIKDEILIKSQSRYYNRKCEICNQQGHFEQHCLITHYYPNKILYHAKDNMDNPHQDRLKYKRTGFQQNSKYIKNKIKWEQIRYRMSKSKQYMEIEDRVIHFFSQYEDEGLNLDDKNSINSDINSVYDDDQSDCSGTQSQSYQTRKFSIDSKLNLEAVQRQEESEFQKQISSKNISNNRGSHSQLQNKQEKSQGNSQIEETNMFTSNLSGI